MDGYLVYIFFSVVIVSFFGFFYSWLTLIEELICSIDRKISSIKVTCSHTVPALESIAAKIDVICHKVSEKPKPKKENVTSVVD